MVNASGLNGDTFGCITFKESLVGETPFFGDIEISSLGLVTISYSYLFLHDFILIFLACLGFQIHYVKCNVY